MRYFLGSFPFLGASIVKKKTVPTPKVRYLLHFREGLPVLQTAEISPLSPEELPVSEPEPKSEVGRGKSEEKEKQTHFSPLFFLWLREEFEFSVVSRYG